MNFLNEDTLNRLQGQLDDETIENMIQTGIQQRVVPALEEIRESRREDPPAEKIREDYAALDGDTKQEIFDAAVKNLIQVLFALREQPSEGVSMARELIRDPYTMEALLLIFDNPDNIDPEYAEQMKEFVAEHVKWAGVVLASEMYEPETVHDVAQRLNLEIDRRGGDGGQ